MYQRFISQVIRKPTTNIASFIRFNPLGENENVFSEDLGKVEL